MGRTTLSAALIAVVAVARLCSIVPAASARVVPVPRRLLSEMSVIKNVNDPQIQELGSWAVVEHVRQANDGMRFSRVVSGGEQVDSGVHEYILILHVTTPRGKTTRKEATYMALLYEKGLKRMLVAFAPGNVTYNFPGPPA